MRHRSERVRNLITAEVIPRTPSGGPALCHDHQRMTMHYGGFLEYLCRRVRWEAVGMAWANTIIPPCPRCGGCHPYHFSSRDRFKCRSCGHQYTVASSGRFRCNKLPLRTINEIAEALRSGESGLSVSKKFKVGVKSVYLIRDRARD